MGRGPKKHIKRLAAPSSWMLDKLGGVWAPKPSPGPHKGRECLPLIIIIRNRLKYALNNSETRMVLARRLVKIDHKIRTDTTYPVGFMDVLTISKTGENFRILYDTKGRFLLNRINEDEARYKLCKVKDSRIGPKGVPFLVTHDGRTIRYPDPLIKANDTIKLDLETGEIVGHVKFDSKNVAYITGGRNRGRIGVIVHRERHDGGFDIVQLKDKAGNIFLTRLSNVFIVGEGSKPWITIPKNLGVKESSLGLYNTLEKSS